MKPTQGPGGVKGNYYARFRRCFHQVASWELLAAICLCKSSAPKLPIAAIDLFNDSNDIHGGPRTRSHRGLNAAGADRRRRTAHDYFLSQEQYPDCNSADCCE